MKIKKTKKSKGQRGNTTHGHGARKKWKKSGHRGGCGMAGSGKRADQKKTLIIKKYGNEYFGKQGITSRGTAKKVNKVLNLRDIEKNYESLKKTYGDKDSLNLSDFKILGTGDFKIKIKIKAKEVSKGAMDKIKKSGGSVEILKGSEDE